LQIVSAFLAEQTQSLRTVSDWRTVIRIYWIAQEVARNKWIKYKDSFLIQSTDATKMARKVQRYGRLKYLFILVHTKLTMEETCRPTIRQKQKHGSLLFFGTKHGSLLAAGNHGFCLRECVDLLLEEEKEKVTSQVPNSQTVCTSSAVKTQEQGDGSRTSLAEN